MKRVIFILFLLYAPALLSQKTEIDSLIVLLNTTVNKYEIAKINLQLAKLYEKINLKKSKSYAFKVLQYNKNDSLYIETNNQLGRICFFINQLDSAIYYFEKSIHLSKKLDNQKQIAILNISLGAIQLRQGNYNKTIKTFTESAAFFEKIKDSFNAAKCYNNISIAFAELGNYVKSIEYSKKALSIFEKQKSTQFKLIALPNLATQYFKLGDTAKAINYNLEAEKLALQTGNKRSLSIIYNNLGSIYLNKNTQKAKEYLKKALKIKNELNLILGIEVTQGNLGYIHFKNKEYNTAIYYYTLVAEQVKGKQLVFAYSKLKDCYKELNNLGKALEFSEKSQTLSDSILNVENYAIFNEIQTKYEIEKKEKEIFELKAENLTVDFKRIQNRNLLFALVGFIVIMLLLVYSFLKNAKRKRIVIQQKLKIKNQEFKHLLKTQEIKGIYTIIETQEKERSRIANDLHDNLGSKIATLKLYVEDVINTESEIEKNVIFNKLKALVQITYNEIRKIAHNKNSGTLISKGLILSTKTIANQISNSDKLDIKVINVNVNGNINNTIQIFRIIQELLTNIIKHANASEAIIQFSEHDKILNVIVEDNGKGFNINKVSFGFGLTNIEKRLEKINGNFMIDSTEGNGTTVILNIPR